MNETRTGETNCIEVRRKKKHKMSRMQNVLPMGIPSSLIVRVRGAISQGGRTPADSVAGHEARARSLIMRGEGAAGRLGLIANDNTNFVVVTVDTVRSIYFGFCD